MCMRARCSARSEIQSREHTEPCRAPSLQFSRTNGRSKSASEFGRKIVNRRKIPSPVSRQRTAPARPQAHNYSQHGRDFRAGGLWKAGRPPAASFFFNFYIIYFLFFQKYIPQKFFLQIWPPVASSTGGTAIPPDELAIGVSPVHPAKYLLTWTAHFQKTITNLYKLGWR